MMKTNINNKDTYMALFVMTLVYILWFHHNTNFVKFWLFQNKAFCSCQNAIFFNIIKEETNFVFSPLVTGFIKVFCCAGGDRSVMGKAWA